MPVSVEELKSRLKVILEDDNLVMEYLRRYGPKIEIKNIKKIKEMGSAEKPGLSDGKNEEEKQGNDPIYEIEMKCSVCGKPDVNFYELRAKSQSVTFNMFMVPIYKGAMGHFTVDYNKLSVAVCPRCFMFIRPAYLFQTPVVQLLAIPVYRR